MKKILAIVAVLLALASSVRAQGAVDAESVSLGIYGGTICRLAPGVGAPSGGATCDLYVDSGGDFWTKRGGTWTVLPRLETANVWTAAPSVSSTEPAIYLDETDQALNLKKLRLDLQGGVFQVQTLSDASAVLSTILTLSRAGALAVSSGITAGSGAVGIIDSTGKIPALSSTYFASLSGANLSGIPNSATTATSANTPSAIVARDVSGNFTAGTIVAALTGNVTGNLTGQVLTAAQTSITSIANLATVGALNAGSIGTGFGAINVGADAITGGAISGTTGTFSAAVSGTTGTFTGVVSGTAGTFSGAVSGTTGTFSSTLDVAGTSTLGTVLPILTDTYDLGRFDRIWDEAYISQLNAIVFALNTQTLFGGYSTIGKQAGSFASAVAPATGVIDFGAAMTVGDFVLVRATDLGGVVTAEYFQVGALSAGTSYAVTRNLSGGGAKSWASGTPYLVLGSSGTGRIDLFAYDGKPRLIVTQQGATYNAQSTRVIVGNLNTYYGYATDVYGAAFGDAAASNLTIDATNGLRIRTGTTNVAQLSGGVFTVGLPAGNRLAWDGANLTIVSNDFTLDSAGIRLAGGAGYAATRAVLFGTSGRFGLYKNDSTNGLNLDAVMSSGAATINLLATNGASSAAFSLSSNVPGANASLTAAAGFTVTGPTSITGDVIIGSNKFIVTAASGSTQVYGTFRSGVTGDSVSYTQANLNQLGGGNVEAAGIAGSATGVNLNFYVNGSVIPQRRATMQATPAGAGNLGGQLDFLTKGAATAGTDVAFAGRVHTDQGWMFGVATGGTGGSMGAGTLNVSVGVYKNGTAYTNPDFVFEEWATGRVDKFAANVRAMGITYDGLLPLADVEAYARKNFQLPMMARRPDRDLFLGGELLMATVEQAYLYLFDHGSRLAALEAEVARLKAGRQ